MSTSTVLRVKRRLEDNPQDAFVFMCKRRKTDTEEVSPALFIFQSSVKSEELKDVKITEQQFKCKPLANISEIINKIRKERNDVATESRFKIVNYSRGIETEKDVCDIVHLQLKDLKKEEEQQSGNYIYDIYSSAKEDFDISMLDNIVSIENYETELVYQTYRGDGSLKTDSEDSEDSNAENNWRNDYPDSDESSLDRDDIYRMIQAMKSFNIDDELSSDADEDKIYEDQSDLNTEDVKRYGVAYAKYKTRVMSEYPDLAAKYNDVSSTRMIEEEDTKESSDEEFYYGQEEDSEQFIAQYADVSSDED